MKDLRCDCDAPVCDPFRDEEAFGKNFLLNPFGIYNSGVKAFHTDIREENDHYRMEMDLPGFKKDDIDIELIGNRLAIRAERHASKEEKDEQGRYLQRERIFGSYSRGFELRDISTSGIEASYENGVLAIVLPKKTPTLPSRRKLDIH